MNYTNVKTISSLGVLLLLLSNNLMQAQHCTPVPLGSDICQNAPELSCNLDGYEGTTKGFTAGIRPTGFCGIVENNQFLSFRADESPILLKIKPSSCTDAKGIQANLYQTDDCLNFTPISACASLGFEGTLTVSAPVVTIGKMYHLMIDGYEGDICDFTIQVVSGILSDVEVEAPDRKMCAGAEIELSATTNISSEHLIYEWNPQNGGNILSGANTRSPKVNQWGEYMLTVTDTMTCCSDQKLITVTQDIDLPEVDIETDGIITCENKSVNIKGEGILETQHIFNWSSPQGHTLSTPNQITTQVEKAGWYYLHTTNNLTGCIAKDSILVAADTIQPHLEMTIDKNISCIQQTAILSAMSTTANTTFSWSGTADFQAASTQVEVPQGGLYQVVATTANGCTQVSEIEIQPDTIAPTVTIAMPDTLDCTKQSVQLQTTASELVAYQWTGPNGFTDNNNNPTINEPGKYTLQILAENGCLTRDSVEVVANLNYPQVEMDKAYILTCLEPVVELEPYVQTLPDYNVNWVDINGVVFSNAPSVEIQNEGTYTVEIINRDNGCTSRTTIEVATDQAIPMVDLPTHDTLTCSDTSIQLHIGNSTQADYIQYNWLDANETSLSENTTVSVNAVGTYELQVSNTQNGCSNSATITIHEDLQKPTVHINAADELTCTQQQVLLDGSNSTSTEPVLYEWQNSMGAIIGSTDAISVAQADTYYLYAKNTKNACQALDSVVVAQNTQVPLAVLSAPPMLNCAQTEVEIQSNINNNLPQYHYHWTNTENETVSNQSSFSTTLAGTYNLLVTDMDNGCTTQNSLEVTQDILEPVAVAMVQDTLTCILTEVAVTSDGTSQGSQFEYEWTNAAEETISNDAIFSTSNAGVYTLIVTNTENGCTAKDMTYVAESKNVPSATIIADITAFDCEINSIPLQGIGEGSTENVEYEWMYNAQSLATVSNIEAMQSGLYVLHVTDTENGCTQTKEIVLTADTLRPNIVINPATVLTCTDETAILTGQNNSSNPLTYTWTTDNGNILSGVAEESVVVNEAGIYSLLVTNTDNSCTSTTSVEVEANQVLPVAVAHAPVELDCVTESVTIDALGTSEGSSFEYLWSGEGLLSNSHILNPEVSEAGIYNLLVTDTDNGCTVTTSVEVQENKARPESALLEAQAPFCFGQSNGVLTIGAIEGGTAPYLYSINNQGFSVEPTFEALEAGSYNLTVQDMIGCEWDTTVVLDAPIVVTVALGDDQVVTLGESVILQSQTTGVIENYIWSASENILPENTPSLEITPTQTGIYQVLVEDENGCQAIDEIVLRVEKERQIYIPNAFSPNEDGANDRFQIFADDSVHSILSYQIFDRWGEQIYVQQNFSPQDSRHGWNGKYRNAYMPDGVYVYVIEIEFVDGIVKQYAGDVTLLR